MNISLILTCAGKGERAGFNKNKLLITANGKNSIDLCLEKFRTHARITQYIITASEGDFDQLTTLYGKQAQIVLGGATRSQSVRNALNAVTGDIVLIHDGARPFVTDKIIEDAIDTAIKTGSAIPVLPSRNTILKKTGDKITEYLGKDGLFCVQTPQAFNTELIKKAYLLANGKTFNDDGEIYMQYIGELSHVEGDAKNVKLTYPQDFEFAPTTNEIRFGTGFDCHKLIENRDLILGGIKIEHDKGLLGHSDADVLTHAIMDAILSAIALRDIGYHFPDTDPQYKNANSMALLGKVLALIKEKGYRVDSISACIMAQKPKLLKHIPAITENLAQALDLHLNKIGISATTLEGLGFVGREEGICVHANAVLKKV